VSLLDTCTCFEKRSRIMMMLFGTTTQVTPSPECKATPPNCSLAETLCTCRHVVATYGTPLVCALQMWGIVLPLDVAKTRIQTAHPGQPWDVGVHQHLLALWQEKRAAALWAGLTPTLVRAAPANACQWLAWEVAMRYLRPIEAQREEEDVTGQQPLLHGSARQPAGT